MSGSLSLERAREILSYDRDTGLLTWKVKPARGGVRPGQTAGCLNAAGYVVINYRKSQYRAHRLAWFIETGHWPLVIDHINGDKTDNCWRNLRDTNVAGNTHNQRFAQHRSKSGLLGTFPVYGGKWGAKIKTGRDVHRLGSFDTAELAYAAYVEAKRRLHPTCTL